MPCYHPISGYRAREINEDTGKRSIVFNPKEGFNDLRVSVPCGRCIGCRIDRSRQWAVRCVHEASLYEKNCFITLTYDDKYLPKDGSLNTEDFQLFMKRLRKKYFGNSKSDVRYFHCGEYGEKFGRPHHHACLFNMDFPDKELWSVREGVKLFRSKDLEDLWPYGFCTIGSVSFESAAYVARYITKKITGELAGPHYNGRKPEFVTMSRKPGIGRNWFENYKSDIFPKDFVVIKGKKFKVPKYYDRCYEATNPIEYGEIKVDRYNKAKDNPEYSADRLSVKEEIQRKNLSLLKRGYESQV